MDKLKNVTVKIKHLYTPKYLCALLSFSIIYLNSIVCF